MPFLKNEDHPEFDELREKHRTIKKEMQNVPGWYDWSSDAYDKNGNCRFLSGAWTVCPVYFGNIGPEKFRPIDPTIKDDVIEFAKLLPGLFPRTTQMLRRIRSVNYAAFSKLAPRSFLSTHQHKNPDARIMHLGILTPAKCYLTVDGESHYWREPGQTIIFNDNLEHSAYNGSDLDRIVLYVDFKKR
jgi:hypothetical protein